MITLTGGDFKALIDAVSVFPTLGEFSDAGDVTLATRGGRLIATAHGVVFTWAYCKADGDLESPIAVDMRVLQSFAPLCANTLKVTLEAASGELRIKAGRHSDETQSKPGKAVPVKSVKKMREIVVTKAVAERAKYLADVAFADGSRAELSCVMMTTKGEAAACNQKTVAILNTGAKLDKNTAIPLALARAMKAKDRLYVSTSETVLKTANAVYSIPSPVKAQKDFPLKTLQAYGVQDRTDVAVCAGEKFAEALQVCASTLEPLSRLDIIIDVEIGEKYIRVGGTNSGTKFNTRLPFLKRMDAALFKLPLGEAKKVIPFMRGRTTISQAAHGDMLITMRDGFILFPAWTSPKKAKRR